MEDDELPIPVAPPVPEPQQPDGRRLWIGNLDLRITEYKFLKMVEKFGALAEFDFLYQKMGQGGADKGSGVGAPRGYAFVTYKAADSAKSAQRTLDGLDVAGRRLAVKWAHLQDQNKYMSSQRMPAKAAPAVLSVKPLESSSGVHSDSISDRIASVEAALSSMSSDNGSIITADTGRDVSKPTYVTYQFIERSNNRTDQNSNNSRRSSYRPYSKHNRPHRK